MLTLALDTTTRASSGAVVVDGRVGGEWTADAAQALAALLPRGLIDALAAGGWTLQDVDLLAVAVGPGSFTGLRVGIATMQGLAVALGRPLLGVSSLEALARCAAEEHGDPTSTISVWVDAWRGEAYTGLYRHGQELRPATVGAPADALAGPLAEIDGPIVLVGDGAALHRGLIEERLGRRAIFAATMQPRLAPTIARLAAARAAAGERPLPDDITPLYVRRPDVERARDARRVG
jgi:tRNA threonylcarbamoyladenosine biosynthesis protein TsaB